MDDLYTYKWIEKWDLTIKQEMTDGTFQSVLHKATTKWFTNKYFEGEIIQHQSNASFKITSGYAMNGPFNIGTISFDVTADNGKVRKFQGDIIDKWSISGECTSKDDDEHKDAKARWSAFRYRRIGQGFGINSLNTNELILEVDSDGTISLVDCYIPKIREEFYDLSAYSISTPKLLVQAAEAHPPLQWLIASHYERYRENPAYPARLKSISEEPEDEWVGWVLGIDKKTFSSLRKGAKKWLLEKPDWGWEEDYFVVSDDPKRAAYDLLDNEPGDLLDALGIDMIEGDRPGSNYCYAKLSRPIEEANAIAEGNDWNYTFQKKTDDL